MRTIILKYCRAHFTRAATVLKQTFMNKALIKQEKRCRGNAFLYIIKFLCGYEALNLTKYRHRHNNRCKRNLLLLHRFTAQCAYFLFLFLFFSFSRHSFIYCPVYEFSHFATCSGVPAQTSVPPLSPPSGPRSII